MLNNTVQIFIQRIKLDDQPLCPGFFIRNSFYGAFFLRFFYIGFNIFCLDLVCISSTLCKYFNTIIKRWVMACCYHHAIGEFVLHNIEHD